ncbi:MAG: aminoacetone oxidase family FAD-binding enzyme [Bacteroidales bacterium]|nr:aminoacetone oxidase family FAD-binding enzyme [Bacteroidales bacterium]
MKKIAIIGAGAAGCFCAAELRRMVPEARIDIYESGKKPLAKVAITGGGRCNLTNDFQGITSLAEAYPRGERLMRRALKEFDHNDTIEWFTRRGVPCTLQDDHCYFPVSQDAMDIVRTLLHGAKGADIHLSTRITAIRHESNYILTTQDGRTAEADIVVVTTGGSQKTNTILDSLGIKQVPPVPSLFTFRINDSVTSLMGTVVNANVALAGTTFRAEGPLLITDWGMSGPAILKLSSYAARYLNDNAYGATLLVNWAGSPEPSIREALEQHMTAQPQKQLRTTAPFSLPSRLWSHICARATLREDLRWAELGRKGLNRLAATISSDQYQINGRAAFRQEFVTAGGVPLTEISPRTFESTKHQGLFFAGEILDIDAVTGGFNLQAAWTTGHIVARSIASCK